MSVEYDDKDTVSVLDKLAGIGEYRWDEGSGKIAGLNLSKSEFYAYCFSSQIKEEIEGRGRYGRIRWLDPEIIAHYSMVHKDVGDKILDDPKDKRLVDGYMRSMAFNPLRDYDRLIESNSADIRTVAASFCSFEQLLSLKNDRSKKVRKVAYGRLGPIGHLDDMLMDKSADIREVGISLAPFGYKKLSSMTNEIARGVFVRLIEKISKKDLPLLLVNRNLKDRWISSKFESRMNSGF